MAQQTPEGKLKIAAYFILAAAIVNIVVLIIQAFAVPAVLLNTSVDSTTRIVFLIIVVLEVIFTVLFFIAYQKIKQHVAWGRLLALWLAVPMLLSFPIGTMLSILIWMHLKKPEVKALFTNAAPPQQNPPQQQPP